MIKHADFPIEEVVAQVNERMRFLPPNSKTYQKFTCSGCGQRLTIEEPNVFHAEGTCDRCPAVTKITKCNYMLVIGGVK
jgi:hypothetical protein